MRWLRDLARAAPVSQWIFDASPALPKLTIHLTPYVQLNASSIDVRMTFATNGANADAVLFKSQLAIGPVHLNRWRDKPIASDVLGHLDLHHEDQTTALGSWREWSPVRDAVGEVQLWYTALPEYTTQWDRCGAQVSLQEEEGGLLGAGLGFLPYPASDELFDIRITWDLTHLAEGSQIITSHGHGDASFHARAEILLETGFAIGAVHSYESSTHDFGYYYFANPSFNTTLLAQNLERMYTGMASFFHDPTKPFKVFLRHDRRRCASGNGLYRSFIYSYSDLFATPAPELYQLGFLAHETVHNWPVLEMEETSLKDQWWTEGIADYYSVVLPYRLGIVGRDEFIEGMNYKIGAYFTNPAINLTNDELVELFWEDHQAQKMIYERGFTYFVLCSEAIPRLSNGTATLDDLVIEMVQRRLAGKPYGITTWLGLLASHIGDEAYSSYDAIGNATLFIPAPESLGDDYILRPVQQEQFYLGIDASSLSPSGPGQRAKGLDPESRAAVEGGLRETDVVTPRSSSLGWAEEFGQNFTLVVLREEKEVQVTWWPRTWDKVRSFQWEKVGR